MGIREPVKENLLFCPAGLYNKAVRRVVEVCGKVCIFCHFQAMESRPELDGIGQDPVRQRAIHGLLREIMFFCGGR
jgi:hypothetical protein